VRVHCLLPHEILHCLSDANSQLAFDSIILGNLSEEARVKFWEHCKTKDAWKTHPVLNDPSYCPKNLIPWSVHCDGAQMYREDEYCVFSISSVFSNVGLIQDVLAVKFPCAILPEKHMRSPNAPSFKWKVFYLCKISFRVLVQFSNCSCT